MKRSVLFGFVLGCTPAPVPGPRPAGHPEGDPELPSDDTAEPIDSGTANPLPLCPRLSGESGVGGRSAAVFSGAEGLGSTILAADSDGDGLSEVLVGAAAVNTVYGWTAPFSGTHDVTTATVRLIGEPDSGVGTALAWGGDVTGDGIADLWVGAPLADDGIGRVYLVPGPVVGDVALADAITITGFEENGRPSGIGWSLQAAGDLTGDGVPDLIVGGFALGYTWLVSGAPAADGEIRSVAAATLVPVVPGRGPAYAAGAGDVDADGQEDLLVGAPDDELEQGRAYLMRGPLSGTVQLADTAAAVFHGNDDTLAFGLRLAGGHDVTGDDVPDVWIGDVQAGGGFEGRVFLFDGTLRGSVSIAQADAVLSGQDPYDFAGLVASPGDLDGDGYGDVVIGSIETEGLDDDDSQLHATYVLYGPFQGGIGLGNADATLAGGMPGGLGPQAVSDADGDGCQDLWLGSPERSSAWLVLGPPPEAL